MQGLATLLRHVRTRFRPDPGRDDLLERAPVYSQESAQRILVAAERSPAADGSPAAGGMLPVLALLRRLGYGITFVSGVSREQDERAARDLGVDVLRGFGDAVAHLATAGERYRAVILSGKGSADRLLAAARAHALRATVIYAPAGAEPGDAVERFAASCADLVLASLAPEEVSRALGGPRSGGGEATR